MSLFPSSSSPSVIALHKASSNPFSIPLMIRGAHSPPKSLPAQMTIPTSFPSLLDVTGTTASSYAIGLHLEDSQEYLVSHFSPLASRTRSQSHRVTCLATLRRTIQTLRLCVSHSFLSFSFTEPFWGSLPADSTSPLSRMWWVSVGESLLHLPAYLHSDLISLAARLP